jgi:hypothetical protein
MKYERGWEALRHDTGAILRTRTARIFGTNTESGTSIANVADGCAIHELRSTAGIGVEPSEIQNSRRKETQITKLVILTSIS